LTAVKLTDPSHGSVMVNTNGSFQYAPADNFNGTDTFTIAASDGSLQSAPATVTITVTPVTGAGDVDLYAKSASAAIVWSSPNGRYSFAISGTDLRAALGLVNTTGAGSTVMDVQLTIAGAALEVSHLSGDLQTAFTTTAGKASRVKFAFKKNRTLTGVVVNA